jgi:hypothetical protein
MQREGNEFLVTRQESHMCKRNISYQLPSGQRGDYDRINEKYIGMNPLIVPEIQHDLVKAFMHDLMAKKKKYPLYDFLDRVCSFTSMIKNLVCHIDHLRITHDLQNISYDSRTKSMTILVRNFSNPRILNRFDIDLLNETSYESVSI